MLFPQHLILVDAIRAKKTSHINRLMAEQQKKQNQNQPKQNKKQQQQKPQKKPNKPKQNQNTNDTQRSTRI